jgi:hypothetical protein
MSKKMTAKVAKSNSKPSVNTSNVVENKVLYGTIKSTIIGNLPYRSFEESVKSISNSWERKA